MTAQLLVNVAQRWIVKNGLLKNGEKFSGGQVVKKWALTILTMALSMPYATMGPFHKAFTLSRSRGAWQKTTTLLKKEVFFSITHEPITFKSNGHVINMDEFV